jgi:hypothetical protein
MITGEKRCGLVEDFWPKAERDHLAVALSASGFEKTHRHFAGTLRAFCVVPSVVEISGVSV